MWNPFRDYLDWRTQEREADRAVLRDAVSMLKSAFDAQRAQSEAFQEFLEGFRITAPPEVRQFDEASDDARYLHQHGLIPESPQPFDPSIPAHYRKLFESLDTFGLDA